MSVTSGVHRRRRRVTAVSTAVLAVAVLVVSLLALRYDGLSSSDVEVNNGGVFVSNEQDGMIGRLNVDAAELDARLALLGGKDTDIIQSGYHVFVTNDRGFQPVDTAQNKFGSTVSVGAGTRTMIGKDRVVITVSDGRVWILTPDQAAGFRPDAVKPAYNADGQAPIVAISTEGTVFILDGDDLHTFPRVENTAKPKEKSVVTVSDVGNAEDEVSMTTVGEQPVIVDKKNRLLRLPGQRKDSVDLAKEGIRDPESVVLQQPSRSSDVVLLASADAAWEIPLDGRGKPQQFSARGTGQPTAPAQVGGCSYAAWNGSNTYLRHCGDAKPEISTIEGAKSASDLKLRVNGDLVVLNDQKFGLSWMIADNMKLVDDWNIKQKLQVDKTKEKKKESVTSEIVNSEPKRDKKNRDPVANPDHFGVRAGQNVVLPVVRNDTDPDGDVLTASLSKHQPGIGKVTPIQGGTQLQIEVDDDAKGSAEFTYEVDDGRGGTDAAKVSLDVHAPSDNSAPESADKRTPKVRVRSGESVSFNVLPYWQDPEGDAFFLANATVPRGDDDAVTFRPDGMITFDDAGLSTGKKNVTLTFQDQYGARSEGTLEVESVDDPNLAPITTADHVQLVAGQKTTVKPLDNDMSPGGGDLELSHVGEVSDDLTIEEDLEAGTFVASSDHPGTYYVTYTVSAGAATSKGLVRVDVVKPTTEAVKPVPVDDFGVVTAGTDTLIDPLENDIDPTGGVLVVNSVDVPEDSGLKATIIGHSLVRVQAEAGAAVSDEPVPLTYEVANATGSARGTVRVMVVQTDTQLENPVAVPDRTTVRAGDVTELDVLGNDKSPTNSDLHLGRILESSAADDRGHIETTQDKIRFIADPDARGEAVFTYEVVDETGRTASARSVIRVVPKDDPNDAPKPPNLVARTVAGTPVRIPVDTTGIDPDGDSVMLTGIGIPAPQLGTVTKASGKWIEYTPHKDAVGTDKFVYQVIDRKGAVGTGEVLVGVAKPQSANQPPYAQDDTVEVRPGRNIQVPVLDNDSDPEGAPLAIVHDKTKPLTGLKVDKPADPSSPLISTTVPDEPGTHSILYTISDGQLTSTGTATIKVDPNAPLKAPIARDDYVEAAAVIDPDNKGEVEIDALANDIDPDGSVEDLKFKLDGKHDGVSVTDPDTGTVRIQVKDGPQQIRYSITDQDDQTAYGYIWVPGAKKQAPVWVGPKQEVEAGKALTIDLADNKNVRVRPGGGDARISDPEKMKAEHSDGTSMVDGESKLRYVPAKDFSGDDTITVEVADGDPEDPTTAVGTLSIPVTVTSSKDNKPPTLQGAQITVEQGAPVDPVNLAAGANDPDGDKLTFSLPKDPSTDDVDVSIHGDELHVEAGNRAEKGSTVQIPVAVSDGENPPVTATFEATVTGSKRHKITAGRDDVRIDAGTTKKVAVLKNDSNPFPGEKRKLLSADVASGKGTAELSGDQVSVTPDEDFHGILTVDYKVEDATGDPDRVVTGQIRATVRGTPEAPTAPRVGEVGDGSVELKFTARADNGAPITGYQVRSASGPAVSQKCASTSCTIKGLKNDTEYTFTVRAINDVGPSDPSHASAVARPDVKPDKPAPPQAKRGDRVLNVRWSAPHNRGSAIRSYDLRMMNTATGDISNRPELSAGTKTLEWGDLTNGQDYKFQVRAHNNAEDPSEWSEWSSPEHPAGKPKRPAGTIKAERVTTELGGAVKLTWPEVSKDEANGEPITGYVLRASSGQKVTVDPGTSYTWKGLDPNKKYTFTYSAVNSVGTGKASKASNAVTPYSLPPTPTGVKASLPSEGKGDGPNGRAHVSWSAVDVKGGTSLKDYVVRWDGGSKTVPADQTSLDVSGLKNGSSYSFTVQARNRFTESEISKPSNSVRPYTKPKAPDVSGKASNCSGNSCPVSFSVSTNGDGGAGGSSTIQYQLDGSGWKTYSGTITASGGSGKRHTVKARVKNSKGLTSPTASTTTRAKTATPEPKLTASFYGDANDQDGCRSHVNCKWVDATVKNLEPHTTYSFCLGGDAPNSDPCWYPIDGSGNPVHETFTTDGNGNWTMKSDGRTPFWGNKGHAIWIEVKPEGGSKYGKSNKVVY